MIGVVFCVGVCGVGVGCGVFFFFFVRIGSFIFLILVLSCVFLQLFMLIICKLVVEIVLCIVD